MSNYGKLYDEQVADTYDRDEFGLLSGLRGRALAQVRASALPADALVVDLGAGTGESLVALRDRFAGGRFVGIDLSERMLSIARTKIDVQTFTDDVLNANAYVADGAADLVLAHFLTTFVDRTRLFGVARRALRTGGVLSLASSTYESLFRLRQGVAHFLGDAAAADAAAPAPPNDGTMEAELRACGFEITACETFTKPVSFDSFDECLDWGLRSGFFTQFVAAVGLERIRALQPLTAGMFPAHDEFMGVAITAVAIER